MTYILMTLILLTGAVIQTLSPAYAPLGQAKAPVLLACVLYYALNRDARVMLVAAAVAGFIQDSLSGIPLGYSSSIFALLGWFSGRYRELVMAESIMTPVIFGGVMGSAGMLLQGLLLLHAGTITWRVDWMLLRILGGGVLGAITAPVVFYLAHVLERAVGNIETKETIGEVGGTS
jgi:rod shape-determining protein MreD